MQIALTDTSHMGPMSDTCLAGADNDVLYRDVEANNVSSLSNGAIDEPRAKGGSGDELGRRRNLGRCMRDYQVLVDNKRCWRGPPTG